jgi:hypothetical protein
VARCVTGRSAPHHEVRAPRMSEAPVLTMEDSGGQSSIQVLIFSASNFITGNLGGA